MFFGNLILVEGDGLHIIDLFYLLYYLGRYGRVGYDVQKSGRCGRALGLPDGYPSLADNAGYLSHCAGFTGVADVQSNHSPAHIEGHIEEVAGRPKLGIDTV